ncbi:Mu transposase C-terminal domain-containing protein [Ectothiorhodospira shaposhnikovii]|uniref:Mu transposase C-terminal domain-containing protein n=1 Tax=Ectothiorhodospira shaposhnikovii TaxID=1054 RepID=UPI001EE807EF|nr:DDE-type integrase/transposase/recombinase [Ectothiorhodospira shaposhnikovii]MCG5512348.1 DDE-type integrase/transposase/recombinase [Ectothiorhodospira shaposhnikovii]
MSDSCGYEIDMAFDGPDFAPKRQKVDVKIGAYVQINGKVYRITEILDFSSVIGVDVETLQSQPLRISDLRPLENNSHSQQRNDLLEIGDKDWREAERRFEAIKPLLRQGTLLGRSEVSKRAQEVGVDTATLYRWIKRYNAYGSMTALIPMTRGWKRGKSRIGEFAEKIIEEVIQNYYLTHQRSTDQKAVTEVQRICAERGVSPPSPGTIRSRISRIPEKERLRKRGYRERAKNKFIPTPGRFPDADYPLAVIQIDHTPADIILVDDAHRKPIGRPWITLAMDIYSRMVTGYYLSFDPPSETSVAMCVSQSMLPKEEWLLLHKVDADWPVWGYPKKIHVDNGADFRSDNFQKSCLAHGIQLEFRPVGQPQYGGHIERLLGTLLRDIHDLPGTTFSSVKHKEGYESEKHAAMTLSEFEEWLVTLICKVYHHRLHSGIGMSPLKKWEIGVFGVGDLAGIGIPPRPADRHTVYLDFLPSFHRTIQTFGVTIDGMHYYDEALRPWINATSANDPKKKREFVFRRDPRDISAIWFFDPDLKQYFKIPFADLTLPAMSIWEYRQARELLKKQGAESVNEQQIFAALTELRGKVDEAKGKTKKARRQAQRRVEHEKKTTPAAPIVKEKSDTVQQPILDGLIDGEIDFMGDIS